MDFISNFGEILAGAKNFYLVLACVGSVFFVFILLSTLLGGAGEGMDVDHDFSDGHTMAEDISGLKLISLKSVIAFITFFGWSGFFWGESGWLGFGVAWGCGLLMMFLTSLILFLLLKLQQSGTIKPEDFINCKATVYLTIPAERRGHGKITVQMPNCTREAAAVADKEIASGSTVKVIEMIAPDIFLVKTLD